MLRGCYDAPGMCTFVSSALAEPDSSSNSTRGSIKLLRRNEMAMGVCSDIGAINVLHVRVVTSLL